MTRLTLLDHPHRRHDDKPRKPRRVTDWAGVRHRSLSHSMDLEDQQSIDLLRMASHSCTGLWSTKMLSCIWVACSWILLVARPVHQISSKHHINIKPASYEITLMDNRHTHLTFLLVVIHEVSLCRQASHTSSGIRPSF
jgi:hypothetical protein